MNKQIEKLLGQALDSAVPETWTTLTPEQFTKVSEKFTELIVRECMEQVYYTREDMIDETISQNIKARMATHFGVEE